MLRSLLVNPSTIGLDLDAPETTALRAEIISSNGFLHKIYEEWYMLLVESIPEGEGDVLEIGSGAGFLRQYVPELITSDVFPLPGVDRVIGGHNLPFDNDSLRSIVMTNVLHHLHDVHSFFREATRCVRPGGTIAMIEPWLSSFSRTVYTRLHHEPFDPEAQTWEFEGRGPLSDANGALPWIIFERDRDLFLRDNPDWSIARIDGFMPFRYLISGGISMRGFMPAWTFGFWKSVERFLPYASKFSMFAHIVLHHR